MRLQKNQDLSQLIHSYESKLESGGSPNLHEEEYKQLVAYYECSRQFDQVIELLDLAIEQRPYSIEFLLRKANFLLTLHREDEALSILDKAELLVPGDFSISILKIEALANTGQLELARIILEALPEPQNAAQQADYYLAQASWYEHQLAFEKMFLLLSAALEVFPTHQRALEKVGLAIEITRKYDESIQLHEGILDKDPYAYQAWFNLGQALVYQGRYEEAIDAYEYAFIIDAHFELAYREYIDLCFELRLFEKILSCYEDLSEHFILDTEDFLRIGQCHQYKGELNKAKENFEKAVQLDTYNDEVYFHIAECLVIQEDWTGALHYYNCAVKLENKREEYYAARGEVYFVLQEYEMAENDFRHATRLAPDESNYWLQFCSFLMHVNRPKEALELLEDIHQNDDPELLYARIACLFQMGKKREGIYWLGEALLEDFESHFILFELIPELEADQDINSMIADYYY